LLIRLLKAIYHYPRKVLRGWSLNKPEIILRIYGLVRSEKLRGLRVLEFDEVIGSPEKCGCGFKHDKTLKVVLFGSLNESLRKLKEFGLTSPYAVFYDEITYEVAGKAVCEILEAKGLLVRAPTFQEAEARSQELGGVRTVIAVGGGTVIDVAKYASYVSKVDFVSIPTAPSHDGIVSPIASLFTEKRRKSVLARSPVAAIVDPSILASAPQDLIASGFGDILAKLVSLKDWQLGRDEREEPYCMVAESLIMNALNLVINALSSGFDAEKRVKMLAEALINSGVAMMVVGSSRPASGSEHLISHYLDMNLKRRLRHGIQCALGALAMAVYHETRNQNWWREERYRWKSLRSYMRKAGIPERLSDVGISTEIMIDAITSSWRIRPHRYTILHKYNPTRAEALNILKESGLI